MRCSIRSPNGLYGTAECRSCSASALALIDLLVLLTGKKPAVPVRYDPVRRRKVTVALTAYNDEDSIADAVKDFLSHPLVERVIVVSNNSRDGTFERAEAAGAITVNEHAPGYGRCVYRCLERGRSLRRHRAHVVLCEGDRTFRAYDVDKLLAYAPHADIVNGTRTVEPLRALCDAAQHLHVLRQPVRREAARGQAPRAEHDHRRRHDLQAVPPRLADAAAAATESGREPRVQRAFPRHRAWIMAWRFSNARSPSTSASASARAATSTTGAASMWALRMIMGLVFGWKASQA